MDLVTELLDTLSGIIHEWNTFLAPGGDWVFFSAVGRVPSNSPEFRHPDYAAGQSLRSIKQTFERLENNRQRLLSLEKSLSGDFSVVR
jgi:hypothetical protein